MDNRKKLRIKLYGYQCRGRIIGRFNLLDSQLMEMIWQLLPLIQLLLTQGRRSLCSIQDSIAQSCNSTFPPRNVSKTPIIILYVTVMAHGLNLPLCLLELRCIFQVQLIRYKQMKDSVRLGSKLYQLLVKLYLGIPFLEGTQSHLIGQVNWLDFMVQLHLCMFLIPSILL